MSNTKQQDPMEEDDDIPLAQLVSSVPTALAPKSNNNEQPAKQAGGGDGDDDEESISISRVGKKRMLQIGSDEEEDVPIGQNFDRFCKAETTTTTKVVATSTTSANGKSDKTTLSSSSSTTKTATPSSSSSTTKTATPSSSAASAKKPATPTAAAKKPAPASSKKSSDSNKRKKSAEGESSSSDDDSSSSDDEIKPARGTRKATPTAAAKAKSPAPPKKSPAKIPAKKAVKKEQSKDDTSSSSSSSSDDDSDDDKRKKASRNKAAPKKPAASKAKTPAKKGKKDKSEDEDEEEGTKGRRKKKVKTEESGEEDDGEKKKKKGEEGEEVWKYWEEEELPDGKKWLSLSHNGVYFAEPYVPHGVKMLYAGKPVDLEPEAEEVATFIAKYLDTAHVQKPVFTRNFWKDFREYLTKDQKKQMKDYEKADFRPINAHLVALKDAKKNITVEEKKAQKEATAAIAEKYGVATLNGHKQKISNFRVEPPGLFLGRGEHPKAGMVKRRVHAEDVTINIGPKAHIPVPPAGHRWKEVKHDDTVAWLAMWKENIQDGFKYVWLHASSSVKGNSDMRKFEVARTLKTKIDGIRKKYMKELEHDDSSRRQLATALYLIDRLALRVGNEKGTDEADTVGTCSLRVEHIELTEPNTLKLEFLGKDSMPYLNTVEIHSKVFKNIAEFLLENVKKKIKKAPNKGLFDEISPAELNKYLKEQMPNLSAKVFRTFNASLTLQQELAKMPSNIKGAGNEFLEERVQFFNHCNKEVAILCNHQRTLPKSHDAGMSKIDETIEQFREKKKILEAMVKHLQDPKYPKPEPYQPPEVKKEVKTEHETTTTTSSSSSSSSSSTTTTTTTSSSVAKVKEEEPKVKAEVKIKAEAKDKEEASPAKGRKRVKKEVKSEDESDDSDDAKPPKKKAKKEPKSEDGDGDGDFDDNETTTKKRASLPHTIDKCENAIARLETSIRKWEIKKATKDDTKTVQLGTSKINYIDPRITCAWAKRENVSIEKIFSKGLRDKFPWALHVDADFEF